MSDQESSRGFVDIEGQAGGVSVWGDRLALGLAWIPYSVLIARFWFVADDAFISFRYARNWASGQGLRYNPGDHIPVEGFSNFLWVALTACVERMGLDPARVMPALSTLAGFVLTGLVFSTLRKSFGLSRILAAVVVGVLGCTTPFAVWTTGGLETMSFALLLFLLFRALILRPTAGSGIAGGLYATLVSLSRPEGLYWVLLIVLLTGVSRRRRGQPSGLATCLAILFVGYGSFLAWRLGSFGHLLPTSATAKLSAGIGLDRLARGGRYVTLQALSTLSLFAWIPCGLEAILNRRRELTLPVLAMALGFPVWAILVSGDFMAFGRFLVPGLPFLALLGGLLLARIAGPGERRIGLALVVALLTAVLGVLPGCNVFPVPRSVLEALDFRPHLKGFRSEYGYWHMQRVETKRWVNRGRVLAQISKPGDSIVMSAIGAVGYYSHLFVHDRVGLVTREVAELEPSGDARDKTPGHDNPVEAQWFLDRGLKPTFIRANFHGVEARAELEDKIARAKRNLEANDLTAAYVLDIRQVITAEDSKAEEAGGLTYFFTWRRIPEGVPARVAWREFDRLLNAHIDGGALPVVNL